MPVSVKLFEATFTEHTVTLPDECPMCGCDLHADGALREWNWIDGGVDSHLSGGVVEGCIEAEGCTEYGDEYRPFELWCTGCDTTIANHTGVIPPEEVKRIRDERARRAAMTPEQVLAEIIG